VAKYNKPLCILTCEVTTEARQKMSEKSSEKILKIISEQPYISAKDIANMIGISSRAVEKHISKLKNQGILKRIGPDKGGYWEIIESKKDSP